MGRERQKKKSRSSLPKTRPILKGRTKHGKKKVNFLGNPVIAENWDRKLTLLQNYKRLGLTSRLNAPTGGTELKKNGSAAANPGAGNEDLLAIPGSGSRSSRKVDGLLRPTEARVERDPVTGKILRVLRSETDGPEVGGARKKKGEEEEEEEEGRRRLDDPLNTSSDSDSSSPPPPSSHPNPTSPATNPTIIPLLIAQAEEEATQLARRKRPRQQSKREEEWIAALVRRYGEEDFAAMARDRRLNPLQQTEGDIGRRVGRWIRSGGGGGGLDGGVSVMDGGVSVRGKGDDGGEV